MKEEIIAESPIAARWNFYAIPGMKFNVGKVVSPEEIVAAILQYKGYNSIDEVKIKNRARDLVYTRHLCFYFLNRYAKMAHKKIGQMFGGRDHTTSIHGCQTIRDLLDVEDEVKRDVNMLMGKIWN